jgi:hypothetical protein
MVCCIIKKPLLDKEDQHKEQARCPIAFHNVKIVPQRQCGNAIPVKLFEKGAHLGYVGACAQI